MSADNSMTALVTAQSIIREHAPDSMKNLRERVLGDINTLISEVARLQQEKSQ